MFGTESGKSSEDEATGLRNAWALYSGAETIALLVVPAAIAAVDAGTGRRRRGSEDRVWDMATGSVEREGTRAVGGG